MSAIDIKFNRAATLHLLSQRPRTVQELCDALVDSGVDAHRSTYHRIIQELTREGLITPAEVLPASGRGPGSIRHELTAAGKEEIGKTRAAIAAVFMGPFA
ncbi:MAG: hypothetical protein WC777_03340 [Candidatus Gracilibacteria bacterium]|jgi:DNA-binding PadR family transcriptional regulator